MGQLKCDVCGGRITVQAGGEYGECESCGANYSLGRMREIASGVKVSVTGTKEDVEQWHALLDTYLRAFDYDAVESTVKKILEASPEDARANELYNKLRFARRYFEISNGILLKYTGTAEKVEILGGITGIGEKAFYKCGHVTSVAIPGCVTNIGYAAFSFCGCLKSITIPDGVISIDDYAFSYCNNLTSVIISDSVVSIGNGVFLGCDNITDIRYPESLRDSNAIREVDRTLGMKKRI